MDTIGLPDLLLDRLVTMAGVPRTTNGAIT